jgi:hypothetical protein
VSATHEALPKDLFVLLARQDTPASLFWPALARVLVSEPPSFLKRPLFNLGDVIALRFDLRLVYRLRLDHFKLVAVVEWALDLVALVALEAASEDFALLVTELHKDALDGIGVADDALCVWVLALLLFLLFLASLESLVFSAQVFKAPPELQELLFPLFDGVVELSDLPTPLFNQLLHLVYLCILLCNQFLLALHSVFKLCDLLLLLIKYF